MNSVSAEGIHSLPIELLSYIFQYTTDSTQIAASQVSKQWKLAAGNLDLSHFKVALKRNITVRLDQVKFLKKEVPVVVVSQLAVAIIKNKELFIFLRDQPKSNSQKFTVGMRYTGDEKYLHIAFLTDKLLFALTDKKHVLYEIAGEDNKGDFLEVSSIPHPPQRHAFTKLTHSKNERKGVTAFVDCSTIQVCKRDKDKTKNISFKLPEKSFSQGVTVQRHFVAVLLTQATGHQVSIHSLKGDENIPQIDISLNEEPKQILSSRRWIVIDKQTDIEVYHPENGHLKLRINKNQKDEKIEQFVLKNNSLIFLQKTITNQSRFTLYNLRTEQESLSPEFPEVKSFACSKGLIAMISKDNEQGIRFWSERHPATSKIIEVRSDDPSEVYQEVKFRAKRFLIIKTSNYIYYKNLIKKSL